MTGRDAAASATSTVPSFSVKRLIARSSGGGGAAAVAGAADALAAADGGAEAGDATAGALAVAAGDGPGAGFAPGCAANMLCTLNTPSLSRARCIDGASMRIWPKW
ncbi:hypothetical protein LMG29739_03576 [Paraburkholderia solisilvae]|uniref:Uncharacterized protein n=1 Tax=Paraburkholderia solisilvae TaxID=624376 RepID=A0A6J5E803_9BURK|nr:hypothetical protein LMG29739_03576 [Paraburkholderia solisilvae]